MFYNMTKSAYLKQKTTIQKQQLNNINKEDNESEFNIRSAKC